MELTGDSTKNTSVLREDKQDEGKNDETIETKNCM